MPRVPKNREHQARGLKARRPLPRDAASAMVLMLATLAGQAVADDPPAPPVAADHAARMRAGADLFRGQVRAILVRNCLDCHGGKSKEGDFDLATRESLMASGYVESRAADSHLMAVLRHEAEPFMPHKRAKLSDETLELVARWIDLGAPYDRPLAGKDGAPIDLEVTEADRQFWSFQPLSTAEPPAVRDAAWPRTDVDRFVLARLEQAGIQPNTEADRRTLIRRATFDLLGLPPTPEEVESFVADDTPTAYEKLIDRLLESPHYGERWARHWLDVARFAESHGYEQDYDRPHAYTYRDFLIRALNDDLPYDEFVRWQLAGDELAPDNPQAMMATGFLGAGAFPTQLTEAEFESARYDELDDMTTTTGVAFLGLSIGCARCHDHKFDPIPSRDYYALAAAFTRAIRCEVDVDLDAAGNQRRREEHAAALAARRQELEQYEQERLPGELQKWLAEHNPATEASGAWTTLDIAVESAEGSKFERLPDGSWLAKGAPPARDELTLRAATRLDGVTALRLEALADDSLPQRGPGRAPNGNFALGNIQVLVRSADGKERPVKLVAARATHQQNDSSLSVAGSIDNDPISGWAVDGGGIGHDQAAVFDLERPIDASDGATLTVVLTFHHPNTRHSLGRLRLSASRAPRPDPVVGGAGPDEQVLRSLAAVKAGAPLDGDDGRRALEWFRGTQPRWHELRQAVDQLAQRGPTLELVKAQVTSEGFPHMKHHADDRGYPHFYEQTFRLKRGDPHQKLEPATPGFLQVLSRAPPEHWRTAPPEGWSRSGFQRASLARWMTDAEQGAGQLAARVIVNRLWQHHFGRGIVATPNDFGFQGERPTHPELLDWLARDLIAQGWRLKRLHKLIMTSAVYRQGDAFDEPRATVDRENMLLWRRVPRRLEAEAVRDAMLAVSGRLDETPFGPGTLDLSMRRRSVYFFIKRSQLIPTMMLFDWPEHLVSIGQRPTTTIAPQALMFLNSPQGREYSRALAERVRDAAGVDDDEALVRAAYRTTFARTPLEVETARAVSFLERQRRAHEGAADPAREALVDLCQVLLGTNEFVYID